MGCFPAAAVRMTAVAVGRVWVGGEPGLPAAGWTKGKADSVAGAAREGVFERRKVGPWD